MNMLSFEAKTIIFVIAFILLGIIGLVIDNMRDNKQTPRFDQYGNAHNSNCSPPLIFFGSIVVLLILSVL